MRERVRRTASTRAARDEARGEPVHRPVLPLAALVGALLLAACGTETAGSADDLPRTARTSSTTPAECPEGLPGTFPDYAAGPHLPEDVAPVGVLRCVVTTEDDPATGRWTVVRTERATAGVDAYVASLRMADEPRPEGDYACTLEALLVPWSAVLLPDGSALQVALPLDPCGKPRAEVGSALDALVFETVSTERIEKVATTAQLELEQKAERLGCSYEFKDMIAIEAGDGPDDGRQQVLTSTPTGFTTCEYSADPASSDPVLTFVGGGRSLTAAETATVVAALGTATPTTATCEAPPTRVWGLTGAGGGPWLLVELDGCGRVASDSGALRTLAPGALAAVRGVLEARAG